MDAQSSAVTITPLSRISEGRQLVAILALALVLRLAVIPIPGLHHPDELWQYLEPAHKLAFGTSVDAWEFRAGIRTWIIPVVLAPFMWLGDAITPDGLWHIYVPKAVLALLSLTIVYAWWRLGRHLSVRHGLAAAFTAAVWIDLVYFGARPMSEPVSMALFFSAVVLLSQESLGRNQLVMAGFLLGLTFCVRFQLAPALLCLIVCTELRRFRESMPWIMAGGLGALALDGLIDFMNGQIPLNWIIENFRINLIEGKSAQYGVKPWWYYLGQPVRRWSAAFGPIFILAAVGARRFPALAMVAAVNIAFHSLIPHKEFRFALLSYEIVVFLAAIGTAEAIKLARKDRQPAWLAAGAAGVIVASMALALASPISWQWHRSRALLETLQAAGKTPGVCGLATYEVKQPLTAAYTYYHRNTPIFGFMGDDAQFRSFQDRFNVVIAHPDRPPGLPYSTASCHYQARGKLPLCVYRRMGGCNLQAAPEVEINSFVAKHGV